MKKSFFILLLTLMSTTVIKAQDLKGKISLGVRVSLENSFLKRDTLNVQYSNRIFTGVNAGFFKNKHWLFGVGYQRYRSKGNTRSQSRFAIKRNGWQAFARRHYWFSKNVAFILEPSVEYNASKFEDERGNSDSLIVRKIYNNVIGLRMNMGVSWVFKKKLMVDLTFHVGSISCHVERDKIEVFQNGTTTVFERKIIFAGGNLQRNIVVLHFASLGFKYLF